MVLIVVALLVVVGLALLVNADAGAIFGLTQDQTGRLLPLIIIAIAIGLGLFPRRWRFGQVLGNLVLWAGIFGAVMVGYTYREDLGGVAARVFGELVPGSAVVDRERGTATFRSGADGHFIINADINGVRVPTIFDTGASAVVLTREDAERAGIATDALNYTVSVSTANGTGRAARVRLDSVDAGGIVRNDIPAFVAEAGALDTSLLGMSFLGTLSRYAVSGNSLELVD